MTIPKLGELIFIMNSHFQESNEIFEKLIVRNCYPDDVFEIIKSVQGTQGFCVILISLFVNSINKNGQDDFMKIIAKDTHDQYNNVNSVLFFSTMSMVTTFVFGLENLFKRILEDKGITFECRLESILKEIKKITNLSDVDNDVLYILKEMRNGYHGNMKFYGKRDITLIIDKYTFQYKQGSPVVHLEDYSSKIISM